MASDNKIHNKDMSPQELKKAEDLKKAKENPELSPDELKNVTGGKLGAPIFKKTT